jgi:hypothetical protein
MTDVEKVIKGIQECDLNGGLIGNCPYKGILAMLKEQEQAMKEKDGTISNLIAQIKEISQCYERVVLCKDCKYARVNRDYAVCKNGVGDCSVVNHNTSHPLDWYCADGQKGTKEDQDD